ncbi:ankyrin domain protein (macronuclear) [Tetrahymena thermophila SB210]|uniref:Ankyrin domain protein n=1 Tax=Tetrahymena thermophila (strain SB210) TaxID=312017 RepID=I7MGR5_TETTS|nr:ankyrin domain protein [Tetrahymena thermophila SB210]EAS01945.2 ankyrin domain protein [Tetrahymena thermophila SB210]|eukprot:XP_001022190.2 ankyrin domain protein [Tetrahymena thermophila SB210]
MDTNKKIYQNGRVKSHSLASNYSAQISSTSTNTNFYVQTFHLISPQSNKNSTSKFYFPKNNNGEEEDIKHIQNIQYQHQNQKQLKSLSYLTNNIIEKQTRSRSKSNKHFILSDLLKASQSSKDFKTLPSPSQIQSSRSCINEKYNQQFLNINSQIDFQPSLSQSINFQPENNTRSFLIKQQHQSKTNFQNNISISKLIQQIDMQRNNLSSILSKDSVQKNKNSISNHSQLQQTQLERSLKDFDVSIENDDHQYSINQRNKMQKKLGSIIKNQSDKSLDQNLQKFQDKFVNQNNNKTNVLATKLLKKNDSDQTKKLQIEANYEKNSIQTKETNKIANFFNIFKDSPKYDDIKFKLNVPTCFKNVFKQEKSPNSKQTQMQLLQTSFNIKLRTKQIQYRCLKLKHSQKNQHKDQNTYQNYQNVNHKIEDNKKIQGQEVIHQTKEQIVCQNQRNKLSPGQALTALRKAIYHLKSINVKIEDFSQAQIFSSKPFQKKFSYELIQAAKLGDIMKVIECLNENRFLVFDFDYIYQTALHWATKRNHYQIVDILIKNGADVNQKDIMGRTPLFFALKAGLEKICLLLLENKASPWSTSQLNYLKAANENIQIILYLNKFKQIDIILGMIPKQKHQLVWQKYIQTLKS